MKEATRRLTALRIKGSFAKRQRDLVARESPTVIFLNDVEIATLLCSPKDVEYLAAGFLFGEGLIDDREDIKSISSERQGGAVWVETIRGKRPSSEAPPKRVVPTGCGKGLTFSDSSIDARKLKVRSKHKMAAEKVPSLMREFQARSSVFRETGGVHSAGLANEKGIVYFSEDIGRHNAVDKVLGERFLKGDRTGDLVLVTTGRISSDIVAKAARSSVPIILSKSAPTDLAVRLAEQLGITIVGFARGSRMNVYTNEERISTKTQNKRPSHS